MSANHKAKHDAKYSDQRLTESVLEDKTAETLVSSETPLVRTHLAQKHYRLLDISDSLSQTHIDCLPASLAVEAAIAIVINGIHYAVLMASPSQLEDLAIGFLYSEGLIQHRRELLDWDITQLSDGADYQGVINRPNDTHITTATIQPELRPLQDYDVYMVELVLNQRCHQRILSQKRQLAGRTGCGMCGITGLTQALPDLSAYQQCAQQIKAKMPSLDRLLKIKQQVDETQRVHQLTGAVHAAATIHEQQLYLFEDIGRHNALDKLIGWQLRQHIDIDCVLMTSRLSIELVQKSIRGRIPWLVGMSAPTSTAVRVAEHYGLGVAGFLRDNRVTYYSGT